MMWARATSNVAIFIFPSHHVNHVKSVTDTFRVNGRSSGCDTPGKVVFVRRCSWKKTLILFCDCLFRFCDSRSRTYIFSCFLSFYFNSVYSWNCALVSACWYFVFFFFFTNYATLLLDRFSRKCSAQFITVCLFGQRTLLKITLNRFTLFNRIGFVFLYPAPAPLMLRFDARP